MLLAKTKLNIELNTDRVAGQSESCDNVAAILGNLNKLKTKLNFHL